MGADQRRDQPGDEQHVDRIEARQRRCPELWAGQQEVVQVRTDERAGAVDVHADDRGPVGLLIEGQQVARERHQHGQHQQHRADHPVELARVLVGPEEERSSHVQEHEDDHHGRAPLVHAADELAQERLVGDVPGRLVGVGRRRVVVHGQEDAGDRLVEEGEHRRRAQGVEPVGPLGDLAEHHPARAAGQRGALVDPVDGGDAAFLGGADRTQLLLAGTLGRPLEGGRDRRCGELQLHDVPGSLRAVGRDGYRYWPMPSSGSPGKRGEKRRSSEFTEKRGPISTWPSRTRV